MEALVLSLISLAAGFVVGRIIRMNNREDVKNTDEICNQEVNNLFSEIHDELENCKKSAEIDSKKKHEEQVTYLKNLNIKIENLKKKGCASEEELKNKYPETACDDTLIVLLKCRNDQEIEQFMKKN